MDLRIAGNQLKLKRIEQRKTLAEIAAKTGVNVGYLSQVERGERNPKIDALVSICSAYDMKFSDLVLAVEKIEEQMNSKKKQTKFTRRKKQQLQSLAVAS